MYRIDRSSEVTLSIYFKVYLVTGGYTGYSDNLTTATTEILREGGTEWTFAGELPSPRYRIKGASLNNDIFMVGEFLHIRSLPKEPHLA